MKSQNQRINTIPGFEASYLAGAQAKRANELKDSINRLRAIKLQICTSVAIGALVKVLDDEDVEKLLFVVPTQGGEMIEMANHKIMAVSPDALIAKNLKKKKRRFFEFTQGGRLGNTEVLLVKIVKYISKTCVFSIVCLKIFSISDLKASGPLFVDNRLWLYTILKVEFLSRKS